MPEDIAKKAGQQRVAAHDSVAAWGRYAAFIGLDVHKETIAVSVAVPGRDKPQPSG